MLITLKHIANQRKSLHKMAQKRAIFFTVLFLYCCFTLPVFSQDINEAELNRIFTELNRAYGFCQGQSFTLNRIQNEIPELRSSALVARLDWNSVFGQSCDNVEKKISLLMGEKWLAHREKILSPLKEALLATTISRTDANTFLEIIKKRAKGDIPSPILETLLIFNPTFSDKPEVEMIQGFKKTFRTANHSKAKGVDFQIEYPMSWTPKEAVRPNIIQTIKSENGIGSNMVMLMVQDLPPFNGRKLTAKEKSSIFTTSLIKTIVPDDAVLLSSKPIVLDGHKGGMLVYDMTTERVDLKIKIRTVQFVTIYEDKMIMVNCSIGVSEQEIGKLDERYKRLEPLFKLIANSFVIQSQYK